MGGIWKSVEDGLADGVSQIIKLFIAHAIFAIFYLYIAFSVCQVFCIIVWSSGLVIVSFVILP